ncbi:MAG TPA: NPCBM/NEW2 domain-containing protein [Planctomycetota bacterium]|nr:NPCBM/NEW2 domain-containing protein [Planctomycetota bacterium]
MAAAAALIGALLYAVLNNGPTRVESKTVSVRDNPGRAAPVASPSPASTPARPPSPAVLPQTPQRASATTTAANHSDEVELQRLLTAFVTKPEFATPAARTAKLRDFLSNCSDPKARQKARDLIEKMLPTEVVNSPRPVTIESGALTYVCDLKETEFKVGTGGLGKNGSDGRGSEPVKVCDTPYKKSLAMHPPEKANGEARATYLLNKKFAVFNAEVAIADSSRGSSSDLTFKVRGDGRELWRSRPNRMPRMKQSCSVSVAGVSALELIVEAESSAYSAHAVWLDPHLLKQADASVQPLAQTNAGTPAAPAADAAVIFTTPAPPGVGQGWHHQDVGSPRTPGRLSREAGVFTVTGGGQNIWGVVDSFHFVYQPLSGDGEIIARVVSQTNPDTAAKAGVMFRESLTRDSAYGLVLANPDERVKFEYRPVTASPATCLIETRVSRPVWFRLVRSGSTLTAYHGSDGKTWTSLGSASVTMGSSIYVGLAVCAHDPEELCTAVFDKVTISKAP